MKSKKILSVILVMLFAWPVFAVFNERDLGQTLSVLRYELQQEVMKRTASQSRINSRNKSQHKRLVEMIKSCNELSLMLYSQNQDCSFDMSYALEEVTKQYEAFNSRKMPYDDIVTRLDLEIERYSRLIESLRRLPPQIKEIEGLPDSLAFHLDSLAEAVHAGHHHEHNEFEELEHEAHGHEDSSVEGVRLVVDSLTAGGRQHTFYLDEQGLIDRDSCIFYAKTLLLMYSESKDRIIEDNEHYEDASVRIDESFRYAQDRYKVLQRSMFEKGQENYFSILKGFRRQWRRVVEDCQKKYSRAHMVNSHLATSDWRGPAVIGFIGMQLLIMALASILSLVVIVLLRKNVSRFDTPLFRARIPVMSVLCGVVLYVVILSISRGVVDSNFFKVASQVMLAYAWLVIAIFAAMLIRNDEEDIHEKLNLYTPVIVLGFLIMTFRVIFIPNSALNLIYPPVLLCVLVWQFIMCHKYAKKDSLDSVIGWVNFAALLVSTFIAWYGYIFYALQIMIWWLFQVAALETVFAISVLLGVYEENGLKKQIAAAKESRQSISMPKVKSGEYIRVTWLFDFAKKALVPVLAVLSFPVSVWLALDVFDLKEIYHNIFYTTFFDFVDDKGAEILKVSLAMIVLTIALYFVFRYLSYLLKALYRDYRYSHLRRTSGKKVIHANEINLTLANNVIAMLVWGTYIITLFILLKIPTGAISIIAAGLATGVGLAMKDILNNFIYGIQLMSGRVRVGDWIECDGIRGRVTAISYQSTQMETVEGAEISFLNADLFSKNFKNLTKTDAYEYVKIVVGVSYGTDINQVRGILQTALTENVQKKDKYGRDIVDPVRGISVAFEEFGDSSVDVAVKQYVLVAERVKYIASAKEVIYGALNDNGIEIPFPQRDIHVRQ